MEESPRGSDFYLAQARGHLGPLDAAAMCLGETLTGQVRQLVAPVSARPTDEPWVALGPRFRPLSEVNAWFRSDRFRRLAAGTREGYARDVFQFARWCEAAGRDVSAPSLRDLLDFREHRLEHSERPVLPPTWNRQGAAIDAFLTHLVRRGLLESLPYDRARELRANHRDDTVRSISRDEYLWFRDVGLRGRDGEGRWRTTSRLQHGLRNAVFAQLLVSTGLRRGEANSLTLLDLPTARSLSGATFRLPDVVAKWGSGRDVVVSEPMLGWLDEYVAGEREVAVHAAQRSLRRLLGANRLVVVESVEGQRLLARIGTRRQSRSIRSLTPEERRWAVSVVDGVVRPLTLFIGRDGVGLRAATWNAIFDEASRRSELTAGMWSGHAPARRVHPHMLRHTFGVSYLEALMREEDVHTEVAEARETGGATALRQLLVNPLMEVMRALGHRHIRTTLRYLNALTSQRDRLRHAHQSWTQAWLDGDLWAGQEQPDAL